MKLSKAQEGALVLAFRTGVRTVRRSMEDRSMLALADKGLAKYHIDLGQVDGSMWIITDAGMVEAKRLGNELGVPEASFDD